MNLKKAILAGLAGSIGMFLMGALWHEVILAQFYADTGAEHEGTGIIFLSYLILGGLMAYMYPLGYQGGKPWLEGLRFGILIGILWVFPHGLAMAGAHGKSLLYPFQNLLVHLVEQGVGGVIVGLVYGQMKPVSVQKPTRAGDLVQ